MYQYAEHVKQKQKIYQNALLKAGFSRWLIGAGALHYQFRDDISYPFATNAYFREWLPLLQRPDCFIGLAPEKDQPILFLKVVDDFWHSDPEPLPEDIHNVFQIVEFAEVDSLHDYFVMDKNTVYLGPTLGNQPSFLGDVTLNDEGAIAYVDYHRAYKTEYEVDAMRNANRVAVLGHLAAKNGFEAGESELDIHLRYLQAVRAKDEELPYHNIVGLNENAAVLHHNHLQKHSPAVHRSMLIDAGAQYLGYASDITRTYATDNATDNASAEYKALINAVETLQLQLLDDLAIGVDYVQLHRRTHEYIAGALIEIGVLTGSVESAVNSGITRAFFPHGLGHLIGTQVHDKGGHLANENGELRAPPAEHPFLRCTRTLESGMAFTIEPGIYIIESLLAPWRTKVDSGVNWALVEALAPYGGVRIEDDIVITEKGIENLTRNAFSAAVG
ncbi:Xaa-Pro dipeptidase [Marinibactrum halimedae]|uniref:Xaa-Pro dipeptidase n=1 Tax=Marinibactrum halimedae TaxID=1444977 RepID=A0AA37WP97_9GAMM|nr:Xaa-Pro dipeptidase [Marinibactrum halimedae]MCD9459967.1 Xaa-Pro dipeptidase [Marinibactrum halimedae]GLS28265.1 Xaa-Pro dipeptidase [Marinibactrum halimedae]